MKLDIFGEWRCERCRRFKGAEDMTYVWKPQYKGDVCVDCYCYLSNEVECNTEKQELDQFWLKAMDKILETSCSGLLIVDREKGLKLARSFTEWLYNAKDTGLVVDEDVPTLRPIFETNKEV